MADNRRLIDANAIPYEEHYVPDLESGEQWDYKKELCVLKPVIDQMPTVDAVEVVFCDECENYGKCYPETIFRLARIEKPFCCVGKRKTNTNFGAKMDGDGNA